MDDRHQHQEKWLALAWHVFLFAVDVVVQVIGIFYYATIVILLIAAVYVRQRLGIIHSIELSVGTAALWGLGRLVAEALDACQASRSLGISSTKLHGR